MKILEWKTSKKNSTKIRRKHKHEKQNKREKRKRRKRVIKNLKKNTERERGNNKQ